MLSSSQREHDIHLFPFRGSCCYGSCCAVCVWGVCDMFFDPVVADMLDTRSVCVCVCVWEGGGVRPCIQER